MPEIPNYIWCRSLVVIGMVHKQCLANKAHFLKVIPIEQHMLKLVVSIRVVCKKAIDKQS